MLNIGIIIINKIFGVIISQFSTVNVLQHLLVLLFGTFRIIAANSKAHGTNMTSQALGVRYTWVGWSWWQWQWSLSISQCGALLLPHLRHFGKDCQDGGRREIQGKGDRHDISNFFQRDFLQRFSSMATKKVQNRKDTNHFYFLS